MNTNNLAKDENNEKQDGIEAKRKKDKKRKIYKNDIFQFYMQFFAFQVYFMIIVIVVQLLFERLIINQRDIATPICELIVGIILGLLKNILNLLCFC